MQRTILITILAVLLGGVAHGQGAPERTVQYPPVDVGANTVGARKAAQMRTLDAFQVFTGFTFEDAWPASGIDFEHQSVDDAAKDWKPVHYDHGNGVTVADVDGDGRHDIYFVTQLGENRLYRNLGGGKFEDITERAGVGLGDRIGVTASFADVDNDGDPDLYVTTVRHGNALFLNEGGGRFRDATEAAGVGYTGHSSGAVFFDYDSDGLLDLFLTNVGDYTSDEKGRGGFYRGLENAFEGHRHPERSEASILFRNLGGGRFQDVSEKVSLVDTGWSGDATFVDLDGDRYPELYVLNMQGDDHYYDNVGGERFVDRTAATFPKTPWGAMGVKFFDYNNDGRMDLFVTDMHSDMHDFDVDPLADEKRKYLVHLDDGENNLAGNAFYEQQADGSFREVSDSIGAENFWPWGLSVADLNADGYQDAFISSSMNFPYRYGINTVLLNNRGARFLDSEFILGIEPRRDGRAHKALFKLDCGGTDRASVVCQRLGEQSGTVTVVGAVGTRASAVFDLDDDGDLDIVTGELNDPPQVLISNLSEQRQIHYLKLRLRGTRSNRDGLGALIKVKAGELVSTHYHDGKSGYLAQSSLPLYVGLGEQKTVDSIEVLWPSGQRQTVTDGIRLNAVVEIVEESPEAPSEESGAAGRP